MKLYIYHNGDSSVGILGEELEIATPFEKDELEADDLEYFKKSMLDVYKDFSDFKLTAMYDFELEAEAKAENDFYENIYKG